MPIVAIESYLGRIPVRMAELKMELADVVSLPHMKDSHRRSTVNIWTRILRAVIPTVTRSQTVSKARLKLMGIGVRTVPVEQSNTENA